jgi:hypothetical protein
MSPLLQLFTEVQGWVSRTCPLPVAKKMQNFHGLQKLLKHFLKWTFRPGDRGTAEGALERNLLANKFILLFTPKTSFSMIRIMTDTLQRTAILKLPKLALCPFPTIMTQSHEIEGAQP